MINQDINLFIDNEFNLTKYSPFDELEVVYQQLCRLINDGYNTIPYSKYNYIVNCIAHYNSSLIYLLLPKNIRDIMILDLINVFNIDNIMGKEYELIFSNINVQKIFNKYNVDIYDVCMNLSKSQHNRLKMIFNELLYEISIDKHYEY